MFEEQSKGAGSRAGVERSRQVSFTANLYIGFLDVFCSCGFLLYRQVRDIFCLLLKIGAQKAGVDARAWSAKTTNASATLGYCLLLKKYQTSTLLEHDVSFNVPAF